jgi:hypothetical protein
METNSICIVKNSTSLTAEEAETLSCCDTEGKEGRKGTAFLGVM